MAIIKISGPTKNRICQTIMGKRQAKANPSTDFLFAELRTVVLREVIHSLENPVSRQGFQ